MTLKRTCTLKLDTHDTVLIVLDPEDYNRRGMLRCAKIPEVDVEGGTKMIFEISEDEPKIDRCCQAACLALRWNKLLTFNNIFDNYSIGLIAKIQQSKSAIKYRI